MPILFDPSKYIPDMRESALQGRELAFRSALANAQGLREDNRSAMELQAQRRIAQQRMSMAAAQLQEKQAARASLERRAGARMGLLRQKTAFDQGQTLYERDRERRATDADLVAGLVGPMAAGNLNRLEGARAEAMARDPSLSVELPGEGTPAGFSASDPTAANPYDPGPNTLRITRGGQPVYTSPEAGEVRRREALVADLLAPNAGPWSTRAVEAAGAGVTGEKAAEIARLQQNKLEANETAERVAGARMGQQRSLKDLEHERDRPFKIHDRVAQMAAGWKQERDKINLQDSQFSMVEGQLAEGANPFMQNKALAGIMRAYTGLAATNAERRGDAQGAGMWNYFEKEIDKWTAGAELPPEYRQQVMEMVRHARAENQRQIKELGLKAKSQIYASGLPFASAYEMATQGALAYATVTGQQLSADQIEQEARYIEADFNKRRGGGVSRETLPQGGDLPPIPAADDMGDMGGLQRGSGGAGNLGVTDGGATRKRAVRGRPLMAPGDVERELSDMQREDDELERLWELEYAEP